MIDIDSVTGRSRWQRLMTWAWPGHPTRDIRETQAILTELIMVDARHNTASWLLHGSILAAVQQVLAQLDLERRAGVHQAWKEEQASRPPDQLPPIIQGLLPHPDRPFLRGLQPDGLWRRTLQSTDTKSDEAGEEEKLED